MFLRVTITVNLYYNLYCMKEWPILNLTKHPSAGVAAPRVFELKLFVSISFVQMYYNMHIKLQSTDIGY